MKIRAVRLATTLPLFALSIVAWWFGYQIVAVLCAAAGVLLAVLQWMTVRALLHNAPSEGDASLADRDSGPI